MRKNAFVSALIKLGTAVYLHKKMAEDAEKAAAAVRYLKEKGALPTCTR